MGYTTKFTGKMKLTPDLTNEQIIELNKNILRGSHDDRKGGWPSVHCDWETDGHFLQWNGCEKSYEMDKWLDIMIDSYFDKWGVKVNGKMLARGEDDNDIWMMTCVGSNLTVTLISLVELLGITYADGSTGRKR